MSVANSCDDTGCDLQDDSRCCACTFSFQVSKISVSDPNFKRLAQLLKVLEKELGRKAMFEEFRAAMKGEKYEIQKG